MFMISTGLLLSEIVMFQYLLSRSIQVCRKNNTKVKYIQATILAYHIIGFSPLKAINFVKIRNNVVLIIV